MTTTIRLTEKEATQIIIDHLAAKGHQVSSVKFVCTDNYPSSKDYEGNWVREVQVAVSEPRRPIGTDSTAFLAALGYCLYPVLLAHWREWCEPPKPIWLRYKPTGKVLYFPPQYESKAIDDLLRGLDEIPKNVPFSSPLFERLDAPPVEL